MVTRARSTSEATTYGCELQVYAPELQVLGGVVGLFYTHLRLPSGEAVRVNIDTGSVGIVIPQSLVVSPSGTYYPWAEPTGESMEIVYRPSNDTISGPVVVLRGLRLGAGEIELGPVRALAHTGGGTFMLGVGFGFEAINRYLAPAELAGTSAATALDNPFLNIRGMSREPGAPFQAAYSISAFGPGASPGRITFGQTAESLAGYAFLPLRANDSVPSGFELPWVNLTVTPLEEDTLPTTRARLLIDTGISSMFLGIFEPSPPVSGMSSRRVDVDLLGAAVNIYGADAAGEVVLNHTFVNSKPGDGVHWICDANEKASPSKIMSGGSPQTGSFINTGVHLLSKYDLHFDAVYGQLGLRPTRRASGVILI